MHATSGLQLAYTMVLGAMFAALLWERASIARVLVAPFAAVAVTLFGSASLELLSLPWGLSASVSGVAHVVFDTVLMLLLGYSAGIGLARFRAATLDGPYQRLALPPPAATKALPASHLTLAGVIVPAQDSLKHFKLIGTAGTGQSTAIRELLGTALARGDRAVIADPDHRYLERFYDPARGDVILNPFCTSSRKWDLFAEIDADPDIEALSRALIPEGKDGERAWNGYARTFFSELVRCCRRQGIANDQALHTMVTATAQTDLRAMLAGGPAGHLLEAGNEKMFGSVRAIAASALRALAHASSQEGIPFSVRRWVRAGAGVLFLPYRAGEIAALRAMISAWTCLAIVEAMSGPEGDRHLWFVVDGLDAIGAIDGLEDALVRLRKFGGRCVLGLQSIAHVSSSYGQEVAQAILENAENTLILRCSPNAPGGAALYASGLLGEHQILRQILSRGWHALAPRLPWVQRLSERSYTQAVVQPSQIERLGDLEGFLKLASHPDWRYVRMEPDSGPASQRAPSVALASTESADKPQRSPTEPSVPVARTKAESALRRPRRKAPAAKAPTVMPAVSQAPAVPRDSEAPGPPIEAGLTSASGEGAASEEPQA